MQTLVRPSGLTRTSSRARYRNRRQSEARVRRFRRHAPDISRLPLRPSHLSSGSKLSERRTMPGLLEMEAPVGRNTHEKLKRLIEAAQAHPPMKVAVAHPCDRVSLESVLSAADLRLIEPILVGPQGRIR